MISVVQRVSEASVSVEGREVARIGKGLLILLGVGREDREAEAEWLAHKIAGLRIFSDDAGKMNLSVSDVSGEVLVVSQFTLLGDCRKGRRPDFTRSAAGPEAAVLYGKFCKFLSDARVPVQTGEFGALMNVHLINDGPVTLVLERAAPG